MRWRYPTRLILRIVTFLKDLRDISGRLLRETWQQCQHAPQQRMTDPQAARISSFWHAADPEGRDKVFRRAVRQDTLETYLGHWAQMLRFFFNGWQGKPFPKSLAAQVTGAGQGACSDRISATRGRTDVERRLEINNDNNEDEDDDDEGDDDEDSDEEQEEDKDEAQGANSRYLHSTKQQKQYIKNFATETGAWHRGHDDDPDQQLSWLSPGRALAFWAQIFPEVTASLGSLHETGAVSGRHRRLPTGGEAYGIPRNWRIPPCTNPVIGPSSV